MSKSPIKRNKNLLNLSKEHHFGLLASWKIRRGFDLNVETIRMAEFVKNLWETHLTDHFNAEEQILFNTINHKFIDEALAQHAQLRLIVRSIGDDVTPEKLTDFANLLEQHIRFEERQVFKMLQEELSEEKLTLIGKQLDELHKAPVVENFKDEFWLVKD